VTELPPNPIDEAEPKKRRISFSCFVLLLAALLIPSSIYIMCIYAPPLRISEETTRVTGPLTPDGQIDFFRHLEETNYPPELATDDNGFRIFVRTFGDVVVSNSDFYKEQKYRKLGLDINVLPTMVLPEKEPHTIISEYCTKQGIEITPEQMQQTNKPWTLEKLPMLADWVAAIDAPLDAAAEMIRKPVFFVPYWQDEASYHSGKPQNLLALLLPEIQMFRTLARQYQARANYRIAAGNIDGAIDDTITLLHLGRKIRQDGPLVQLLVGIAIEGLALSIPFAENPEHPPTKEQLLRLYEAINHLPPPMPLEKTFEWERVFCLSEIQSVFHEGGTLFDVNETAVSTTINIMSRQCNQNIVYRRVNDAYDMLTGKKPRTPFKTFSPAPNDLKLLLTSNGRGKIVSEILLSLLFPAIDATERAVQRSECVYNMKRLTLALLLYKAEHDEFPKTDWIEKIKPYLSDHSEFFEQYLRCPSCSTQDEGKTNYALILYDKLPEDRDTLLLVELLEPVPFEEAVVSVEQALSPSSRIGSLHSGGFNTAKQNGAVTFHSKTTAEEEWQRLLGQ
jgi:hypothetical protein